MWCRTLLNLPDCNSGSLKTPDIMNWCFTSHRHLFKFNLLDTLNNFINISVQWFN